MKISVKTAIAWLVVFALATCFFLSNATGQASLAVVNRPNDSYERQPIFADSVTEWQKTHLWYSMPSFEIRPKANFWYTEAKWNDKNSTLKGPAPTGDTISGGDVKLFGLKFTSKVVLDSFDFQLVSPITTLVFTTWSKTKEVIELDVKALPLVHVDDFYMFQIMPIRNPKPFTETGYLYVDTKAKAAMYLYLQSDPKINFRKENQIYWGDTSESNWQGLLSAYADYINLLKSK